MSESPADPISPGWRLAPWLLGAGAAAVLALLLADAAAPAFRSSRSGFLDPGQPWAPLGAIALIMATVIVYAYPRLGQVRPLIITVSMVLASAGAVLGFVAYLPCTGGDAPEVAGPLAWTLNLFVGNVEPRFGPGTACPAGVPPGLVVAQLLTLGAALSGVVAVVLSMSQRQLDAARARRDTNVTLVVGLDAASGDLIRRLSSSGHHVYVIEPAASHPGIVEGRQAGACVLIGDPVAESVLRPIVTRRGEVSLRAAYLVAGDATANVAVLESLKAVLGAVPPQVGGRPELVVRIDDPRDAADWRGSHLLVGDRWIEDAVSGLEVAAEMVVREAVRRGERHLVVCGDSAMALAVLVAATHAAWERAELRAARITGDAVLAVAGLMQQSVDPRDQADELPGVASIDVCCPTAASLVAEFCRSTSEEARKHLTRVDVRSGEIFDSVRIALESLPGRATVVIADTPGDANWNVAGRTSRMNPNASVWAWTTDGLRAGSTATGVHGFRSSLVDGDRLPRTVWARLARQNHEIYRRRSPVGDEVGAARARREWARRPWEELDPFLADDNVRQIRYLMEVLTDEAIIGADEVRQWVHAARAVPGAGVDPTQAVWLATAQAEHGRWLQRRLDAGWSAVAPAENPNSMSVNSLTLPWDALSDDGREANLVHVRHIVSMLGVVSYLPVIPRGGPPSAREFERSGEVRAERLTADRSWTASSGDALSGTAGDWLVRDGRDEWTVVPGAFTHSYAHLEGDRFRRIGRVKAWPVSSETVVHSLERPVTAAAGDWIVEGGMGERWAMPPERFWVRHTEVINP